jgi:FkbM family methyltransferase
MVFYSVWMSKFIDNYGKVYCFESDQNNYMRLESNIKLNQLDGITQINQCAVSDTEGWLLFTEGGYGENYITKTKRQSAVKVQSVMLNNFVELRGIQQMAYMKIDVEGFELQVLIGADLLLKNKKVDIIQLEINQQLNNSGSTVEDLVYFLHEYGYILYKYFVSSKSLVPIEYTRKRENYFAIADIHKVNTRLQGH